METTKYVSKHTGKEIDDLLDKVKEDLVEPATLTKQLETIEKDYVRNIDLTKSYGIKDVVDYIDLLPNNPEDGDIYSVVYYGTSESPQQEQWGAILRYNVNHLRWDFLGNNVDLSNYYKKDEVERIVNTEKERAKIAEENIQKEVNANSLVLASLQQSINNPDWQAIEKEIVGFKENFADNSWSDIARAFKEHKVPDTWSLGSTKPLTLINGDTYTVRVCDMKEGRYTTVDGGVNHCVLEFVEVYSESLHMTRVEEDYLVDKVWNDCLMRTTNITKIWNLLPKEFQDSVLNVKIPGISAHASTQMQVSDGDKIFLAAEREVWNKNEYGNSTEFSSLGTMYSLYEPLSASEKAKYDLQGNRRVWWLRSPTKNFAGFFVAVSVSNETSATGGADFYVAPFFAM